VIEVVQEDLARSQTVTFGNVQVTLSVQPYSAAAVSPMDLVRAKGGTLMLGLRVFNIVLLGGGVAVSQLDLREFDFHGVRLEEQLRVPVALRANAGEYVLEAIPDRFQISVESPKVTGYRLEALQANALLFATEYAGKRSITAVGHNFTGAFETAADSPEALLEHVAWRTDFANAIGVSKSLGQSVTTRFNPGHGTFATVRLEPDGTDPSKVFYDINYTFGNPQAGQRLDVPVEDAINAYGTSTEHATALLHRLSQLGAGS
jgi:hypothetical protein